MTNYANFESNWLTPSPPKVLISLTNYPPTDHSVAVSLRDNGVGEEIQHQPGVGWMTWDFALQRWLQNKPHNYLGQLGRQFRDLGAATIANKLENWNSANNVLRQMESMMEFTGAPWNRNLDLVGVGDKVFDVRGLRVRQQRPNDYISISTNTLYNEEASSSRFDKFLEEVQPNEEVRRYLQKLLGSGLLPRTPDQTFHFWLGDGSNGKGVLGNAIEATIGDMAGTIPSDVFMKQGDESANRFALSRIQGCNLLFGSEINKGAVLGENKFKQLTGEEPTVVEEKGKTQESVTFHATIIMRVNEIPKIPDDSYAMRRRVRVITFNQQFDPHKGQNVGQELAREKEGILLWLLEGAHNFVTEGMGYPDIIRDMTNNAMRASFQMSDFLSECIVVDPDSDDLPMKKIREIYTVWCRDNSVNAIGRKDQVGSIRSFMNGLATETKNNNVIAFRGVKLVEVGHESLDLGL